MVQSLPTPDVVLNDKQLMALIVRTIRRHPYNVQGMTLDSRYGEEGLDIISRYGLHTDDTKKAINGFKGFLPRIFSGVETGGLKIVELKSHPIIEERAYTKKRLSMTRRLFAFGASSSLSDAQIKEAENLDLLDYRSTLEEMIAVRGQRS